ncbi:MFS transporter [Ruminococcus gauvreauii]|uniref:MFS transporter n=1 Tax=Ruminococcus gauvreauii TaxID=438033 RepID=A0ABY5VEJ5_9FIRM|nr:MFS transporter [Ruminococcus gauvreauii]UWP58295.1 MFS transporter [Ruminococcus gauvreauii]
MGTTLKPKSTLFEKIIYGIGGAGSQFVWTFMSMYMTVYYTNSVGIAAAVAGTMMLVARLLDGVSDLLFSWVIKRCHFKLGKIRPWFLICAPLLGISLIACFNVPASLSEAGTVVYIYITYSFTAAVSYTIYNLAASAILPIMSYDEQDRVTLSSSYMFLLMGGVMVLVYLSPILLGLWGGQAELGAWSKLSVVYAIVVTVTVALMGIFIKEKEMPEELLEDHKEQATVGNRKAMSYMDILKIVLKNPYTWILLGMFTFYYLASGCAGINAYFWMYIHGDFAMTSYSTSSLLCNVANLIMILLTPFFAGKIGTKRFVIGGLVFYLAVSVGMIFTARSVIGTMVLMALKTLGMAPITAVIYSFVADLTDVVAQKTNGENPSEVVSMCSSIGTKIGSGVGAALVGWCLTWVGWNAVETVQTTATQNGIIGVFIGLPAAALLICLIFVCIWNPKKGQKKERV